jgi:hypothetical protein
MFIFLQIQSAANGGMCHTKGLLPSGSARDIWIGTDLAESAGVKPNCFSPESGNVEDAIHQDNKVSKLKCCIDIDPEPMPLSAQSTRPSLMELSPEENSINRIMSFAAFSQNVHQLSFKNQQASPDDGAQAAGVDQLIAKGEGCLHLSSHDTLGLDKDSSCSKGSENAGKLEDVHSRDHIALSNQRNRVASPASEVYGSQCPMEVYSVYTEKESVKLEAVELVPQARMSTSQKESDPSESDGCSTPAMTLTTPRLKEYGAAPAIDTYATKRSNGILQSSDSGTCTIS